MNRLNNKVVILTGAGSGQGKAEALLFAKEGAKLVATDVNFESVQSTVDDIKKNNGEAIAIEHDISKEEDWEKVVDQTLSEFGTIDVLINNAGVIGNQVAVEDLTLDTWNSVMAINTTGPFLGTKAVAETMKKNRKGSIVNISSVVAHQGIGDNANYTASKGAVNAFTKQVAQEFGPYGIRVNSVNPGIVDTAMLDDYSDEMKQQLEDSISLDREAGKLTQPEDVAHAVLFLASDDADNIHGSEIAVDGGFGSVRPE